MKLGLVGLGKMGLNMRERLRDRGLQAIGYDPNSADSDADSLEALVESLPAPRAVWVMVPAGAPTRQVIGQLSRLLAPGTSSSTAATPGSPTTGSTRKFLPNTAFVTSTAAFPAGCGDARTGTR